MDLAESAFEDDFADLLDEDFDELERRAIDSTQTHRQNEPGNPTSHGLTSGQQDFDPDSADEGGDIVLDMYNGNDTFSRTTNQLNHSVSARPGNVIVKESHGRYLETPANAVRGRHSTFDSGALWQSETRLNAIPEAVTTLSSTNYLPYRPNSQAQEADNQQRAAAETLGDGLEGEVDIHKLQAEIRDLLSEREKLQAAVRDANRQVFTKSGEISIVRANSERTLREREQKITDLERELKASNDQRVTEQEQARKQQEQLATENRFADHDKVVARTRHRKQAPRQEEDVIVATRLQKPRVSDMPTTPRKNRHGAAGDGFDTHERSPARSLPQSRDVTPNAAEKKRKRPLESPSKNDLIIDDEYRDHNMHFQDEFEVPGIPFPNATPVPAVDARYRLLHAFLDHRYGWGERRTIEILGEFRLPSNSNTTLSSMMYDAIALLDSTQPESSFAASICSIVVVLWDKCVLEKYHSPLKYLIGHLGYLLDEHPDVAGALVDDLVPLLQTTSDINVIPRFKRHRRGVVTQFSSLPISDEVSVADCLDMLLQIVSSFDSRNSTYPGRFWHLIRFDFVSMLLRPSQPPEDIGLLAQLLGYSSHVGSVGSIIDPARTKPSQEQSNFDQAKSEDHLLDRISSMLVEAPKSVDDEVEEYSDQTLCDMRLALLNCLASYANNPHTASSIAQHPMVIGRLVRCMADGYHFAMQSSPNDGIVLKSHLSVVSEATRLVYFLLDAFKNVDIHEKLAKIPGGTHRYLVALSQIVFSEGNLYDVEIDEGVIDCAQSLLEDYVSPEEADQLMEMAGADR